MLHKTRGIVLNYIKYRETSVIARIYTESFGVQSYIINSIRSQRSKKGLALLQPLTILEMVVYHNANKPDGLNRISEYKPAYHFSSIPFDVKKSTMAMFITELLFKTLQEEEHHGAVFEFLVEYILTLDQKLDQFENLHVYLLVQLTHYLGFGIHYRRELENDQALHRTNENRLKMYDKIIELNDNKINESMILSNGMRKEILDYMVDYYTKHIEGFKGMKSLDILSQIFR
ncbi:MAG: DNA repair protein RecO [Reichenbachiella sp.]